MPTLHDIDRYERQGYDGAKWADRPTLAEVYDDDPQGEICACGRRADTMAESLDGGRIPRCWDCLDPDQIHDSIGGR